MLANFKFVVVEFRANVSILFLWWPTAVDPTSSACSRRYWWNYKKQEMLTVRWYKGSRYNVQCRSVLFVWSQRPQGVDRNVRLKFTCSRLIKSCDTLPRWILQRIRYPARECTERKFDWINLAMCVRVKACFDWKKQNFWFQMD